MVPKDILREIIERAKEDWPDDAEMQKHCISEEKKAYEALDNFDFGKHENMRDDFIQSAKEISDSWDEILYSIQSEFLAYSELQNVSPEGIDPSQLDAWKKEAEENYSDYYEGQLEYVKEKVAKHFSIIETRRAVEPIKRLLIELEEIIGSECYNGNIQNYGSWGELEAQGREFRYPVKFYTGNKGKKKWRVPTDLPSEELITGHYAFGANELNIYRALYKAVQHLRDNYGLDV